MRDRKHLIRDARARPRAVASMREYFVDNMEERVADLPAVCHHEENPLLARTKRKSS